MPLSQKQIAAGKQPTEEVIHIKGREEISQAKRQKKARLESEKGKKNSKGKGQRCGKHHSPPQDYAGSASTMGIVST